MQVLSNVHGADWNNRCYDWPLQEENRWFDLEVLLLHTRLVTYQSRQLSAAIDSKLRIFPVVWAKKFINFRDTIFLCNHNILQSILHALLCTSMLYFDTFRFVTFHWIYDFGKDTHQEDGACNQQWSCRHANLCDHWQVYPW